LLLLLLLLFRRRRRRRRRRSCGWSLRMVLEWSIRFALPRKKDIIWT